MKTCNETSPYSKQHHRNKGAYRRKNHNQITSYKYWHWTILYSSLSAYSNRTIHLVIMRLQCKDDFFPLPHLKYHTQQHLVMTVLDQEVSISDRYSFLSLTRGTLKRFLQFIESETIAMRGICKLE